jgi:dCTP deaminase
MSLGPEVFVTSRKGHTKQVVKKGQQVVIPPGQFGMLMTDESVSIPLDAIAFISIKAGIKFRGLINVSGFHVDPGFSGRLKYSVFNAGSENVILQCGEAVFLIWFSNLDRETKEPYAGGRTGQTTITSGDVNSLQGEIASPGSLKRQLDGMRLRFWALQFQIAVLVAIAVGVFVSTCRSGLPATPPPASPASNPATSQPPQPLPRHP